MTPQEWAAGALERCAAPEPRGHIDREHYLAQRAARLVRDHGVSQAYAEERAEADLARELSASLGQASLLARALDFTDGHACAGCGAWIDAYSTVCADCAQSDRNDP